MLLKTVIEDRKLALCTVDDALAHPLVVLHGDPETDTGIIKTLRKETEAGTGVPFHLLVIETLNWNDEMTPFPHAAFFKNGEAYGGKADAYLEVLEDRLLAWAEEQITGRISYRAVTGYSLAGLFAVYALFQSRKFSHAACVSGSMWYPGFLEYVQEHEPVGEARRVYFSIGDREKKSRNPVFAAVEERMIAVKDRLSELGAETVFELNQGNHFMDPEGRTLKGVRWLLRE